MVYVRGKNQNLKFVNVGCVGWWLVRESVGGPLGPPGLLRKTSGLLLPVCRAGTWVESACRESNGDSARERRSGLAALRGAIPGLGARVGTFCIFGFLTALAGTWLREGFLKGPIRLQRIVSWFDFVLRATAALASRAVVHRTDGRKSVG